MEVSWTDFKAFVQSRALSIQWVAAGDNYFLKAFDSYFSMECLITKDPALSSETVDFETNFKTQGNVKPSQFVAVQAQPSFGAKTLLINGVTKKLFSRNTGKQFAVNVGSNDLLYTVSYPWLKITGVECIGAETLDTAELRVYDTATGTYSGYPNAMLNQFGFTLNMAKDYYARTAPFDADIYYGMVIKITYVSISIKVIGVNFIMDEVKS
jgi:hypothetical protein